MRGSVRKLKADYDEAIADYTKLISLEPHVASLSRQSICARLLKRDFDGATADCERALKIDPANSQRSQRARQFSLGLRDGGLKQCGIDLRDVVLAFTDELKSAKSFWIFPET